jgi:hypothetical protein
MSISSMRAELLEHLSVLAPEKQWPNRVAAREVAEFTFALLDEGRWKQYSPSIRGKHVHRAMQLAESIRKRGK